MVGLNKDVVKLFVEQVANFAHLESVINSKRPIISLVVFYVLISFCNDGSHLNKIICRMKDMWLCFH